MRILIIILSLVFIASCSNDDTFEPKKMEFTNIIKNENFNLSYKPNKQHGRVFMNQKDWEAFKENIWKLEQYPEEATVDFSKHMVIAIFDITRTTGGYDASVSSITENESDVVVKMSFSGEGDATQAPTRPYHIVKISKTDKTIEFK